MTLSQAHVVVIGGGFVGQLIQHAIPSARLLDWRRTPPMNHLETRIGPQYLWEPIPGVKSFSFPVITLVDGKPPEPASILAYKRKIGKEEDGGDWGLQFQHETVGWHSKLPRPRVEYNRNVRMVDLAGHRLHLLDEAVIDYDLLLNTTPLHAFLSLCNISPPVHGPWKYDPIYLSSILPPEQWITDRWVLNYLSDPSTTVYRETSCDGKLFQESLVAPSESERPAIRLVPGKIHPHPENEKVMQALRLFGVTCFGRYATWRPDELAHQTWTQIVAWRDSL